MTEDIGDVPVFPLGQVVLFPRALLPLHIFEPRYRAMLKDCLSGSRCMVIAMVPDPADLDLHGNPKIAEIAGLGNVVDHEELPDGRSNILLQGVARVRLDELPFVGPYRRAKVTPLEESETELSTVDMTALVAAVTSFAAEVRRRDPSFEFPLPRSGRAGTLADLSAQHLLADAGARQAALEELDVTRRAELVMRELAMQQRMLAGSAGTLH